MRTASLAAAVVALLCVGCGGGGASLLVPSNVAPQEPPPDGPPRPAAAPDIVLISVSGRNPDFLAGCQPECNEPYLGEPGDAAEAVFNDLVGRGYVVDRADYIAALPRFAGGPGALELIAELERIHAEWIRGFRDPTRIVILAHSHGAVWAHIVASLVPEVPIAVLVSLDGVCLQWEDDHTPWILDHYVAQGGNPFGWNIARPCDVWFIPGLDGAADTEDVAFGNVLLNLEVQSDGTTFVWDGQDNRRPDGSTTAIELYASGSDNHSQVHEPSRGSMQWVLQQLALVFD